MTTPNCKALVGILAGLLFLAGLSTAATIAAYGGQSTLTGIVENTRTFAAGNVRLQAILCGLVYFVVISFNMPLAMPAAFMIGSLLGFQHGFLVCVGGATAGCIVAMLYLRYIAREWVEAQTRIQPLLDRLNQKPAVYIFAARITPALPRVGGSKGSRVIWADHYGVIFAASPQLTTSPRIS